MEIIKIEGLSYSYSNDIKIFEEINLSVNSGERVGIVGANGSGKTTLFSLIMGLAYAQKGDISLFGRICRDEDDFSLARKKIGYLFQDPDDQVFCPTVEEDISFGPLNLGVTLDEAKQKTSRVMEDLGISGLRKRITTKLSWGQKRLVSLAGILAMDPEILILDEPTASIDDSTILRIGTHLKESRHSLLVTSHDKEFLRDICSKVYCLEGYKLKPKEI